MLITGGQNYIYAPHPGKVARTLPFVASETEVIWKIISSSKGSLISSDGVVTVTENYIAGDINGTDIIIEATSVKDETDKATATLHVREAQRVAEFKINMAADTVKVGEAVNISITDFIDQYGEPITDTGFVSVKWEFSNENVSVVDGRLVVKEEACKETLTFAMVRATIDDASVSRKFIVYGIEKYSATEEDLQKLAEAEIEIIHKDAVDFSIARTYDTDRYFYINEAVSEMDSAVAVDVKKMVNYGPNTDYQVTMLYSDGTISQKDMRVADDKGILNVVIKNDNIGGPAADNAVVTAIEVSPVLKFSLGNCCYYSLYTGDQGYVKIPASLKYDGSNLCGFNDEVGDSTEGVNLGNENGYFAVAVPDGFYNIRITKSGRGRSTVKVNGASLGTNVGNPGTGGRSGSGTPYTYLMEDVCVEGGVARISLGEKDLGLAAVEVRRATSLKTRRVHIYIGGDSTASNYYPIEEKEPDNGRYQTGWGQVFSQFVPADDIAVTNIAGGGTYAKSWYELAFPGVIKHGQPGDYFLIEEGINDRTYSNKEEMVLYLTKMIDECRKKDITPVLVTAMQTPKFWKKANGQEVGEFEVPEGSGLCAFADSIRELSADKNVFLADCAKISGEWYARIGRTYVEQNYHLYNRETGVKEDTLHLSYAGAKNVASIIATQLLKMKEAGIVDGVGNTLSGLKFNQPEDYTAEFTGEDGKTLTATDRRVKAVYKPYAL